MTRANSSIACWLPCTAPSSCCSSGGGSRGGELGGELVHGQDLLVAGGLVGAHGGIKGAGTGEGLVQGGGAQLGVPEGVMHALGGDEVLVVAGIADQRPARPEGLAEVVRDCGADEARFAGGGGDPLGEGRRQLQHVEEVALDVVPDWSSA